MGAYLWKINKEKLNKTNLFLYSNLTLSLHSFEFVLVGISFQKSLIGIVNFSACNLILLKGVSVLCFKCTMFQTPFPFEGLMVVGIISIFL